MLGCRENSRHLNTSTTHCVSRERRLRVVPLRCPRPDSGISRSRKTRRPPLELRVVDAGSNCRLGLAGRPPPGQIGLERDLAHVLSVGMQPPQVGGLVLAALTKDELGLLVRGIRPCELVARDLDRKRCQVLAGEEIGDIEGDRTSWPLSSCAVSFRLPTSQAEGRIVTLPTLGGSKPLCDHGFSRNRDHART